MESIRFAKLALTALKDNFVRLEKPYKLTFTVTYKCNSRCLTCGIWRLKPKDELALQEIQEFARKNNSFKWIELTGGEPFLRSDLLDIVKVFYENCKDLYIVTIPTNSLCDSSLVTNRIEEMLKLSIPRLSITLSLDGYRELHDKIRNVPGNFDKVIDMAKKLNELKKRYRNLFFVFGYTMSKYNQGMLERTYEEVRKEIPDVTHNDFHVNVGQISEIYYHNISTDMVEEKEIAANEISDLIKKRKFQIGAIPMIEIVFLKKLVGYVSTGKTPMKSKSLDASLFLDSYGNVYPSIMWDRKIGNIREAGYELAKIWNNGEADEVRSLIKEGREPAAWTACEAYQAIVGNIKSFLV